MLTYVLLTVLAFGILGYIGFRIEEADFQKKVLKNLENNFGSYMEETSKRMEPRAQELYEEFKKEIEPAHPWFYSETKTEIVSKYFKVNPARQDRVDILKRIKNKKSGGF